MTITATIAGAISMLAQFSRTREYAADNLGARISGRPDTLSAALVKISRMAEGVVAMSARDPRHILCRNEHGNLPERKFREALTLALQSGQC